MVQISCCFVILFLAGILYHTDKATAQEKEVLVRDRLVFLLCDQMNEYMTSGKFPEGIKTMPDKYKKIKPGMGQAAGRSMKGIKLDKGNKSNKGKGKRPKRGLSMTVLDLQDDIFD